MSDYSHITDEYVNALVTKKDSKETKEHRRKVREVVGQHPQTIAEGVLAYVRALRVQEKRFHWTHEIEDSLEGCTEKRMKDVKEAIYLRLEKMFPNLSKIREIVRFGAPFFHQALHNDPDEEYYYYPARYTVTVRISF